MRSAADVTRILIADDHPLFRAALREVVARVCPGAACAEAATYHEVLARMQGDERFDLIVVDLMMPGGDELTQFARLRERVASTPTIVVSSRDDAMTIRSVLRCGIAGYVPKSAPAAEIERAVRAVLAGETYVPAGVVLPERPDEDESGADEPLTRRQHAVLEQLALGRSNRQIAADLGIEEITVKAHISAVLRKLHVKNRVQAALVAREYLTRNA